jgi:hypothetical protein
MRWIGTWRNQYASTLRIVDDRDGRISGTFATALNDSGFFGADVDVIGLHRGDCISFSFARIGPAGDTICSFTGLWRDGKLETLRHVVNDSALRASAPGAAARIEKLGWAHVAQTNADTFEQVE